MQHNNTTGCLRTRGGLVLLVLIVAFPQSACSSSQQEDQAARATKLVQTFVAEGRAPGVSVSVGRNGRIVWSEGAGYADVEQRVPVWPSVTKFRVGSVAKPMTAVAIGQLYQSGKLDLDAPVQQYVPTFPEKRGVITTRLLAGHLAGIRHYRGEEFLSQKHYPTVMEGIEIFSRDSLINEPGTAYSYSSYGWNLISAVIEGASGQQFLEYMNEHVFGPIGMDHTEADYVDRIIDNRGRYYERQDDVFVNSPAVDNSYKWAGGGFLSTSDDLVRFGFAHLDDVVLNPETIQVMWTSQETLSGQKTNYGIGWAVGTDDNGRKWAGHGGGSVGGTTYFRIYPDEQVVVAVIANLSGARFGDLPVRVAEIFLAE